MLRIDSFACFEGTLMHVTHVDVTCFLLRFGVAPYDCNRNHGEESSSFSFVTSRNGETERNLSVDAGVVKCRNSSSSSSSCRVVTRKSHFLDCNLQFYCRLDNRRCCCCICCCWCCTANVLVQCDTLRCFLGSVDIRTEVVFSYMLLLL